MESDKKMDLLGVFLWQFFVGWQQKKLEDF